MVSGIETNPVDADAARTAQELSKSREQIAR
jgi:hypothetical protein